MRILALSHSIVINVESSNPLDSFVLCFLSVFLDLTAYNRNIALIYSVSIWEQTTKDLPGQGGSNINCSTVVFIFDVCRLSEPFFWRSSRVPESLKTFQPSYASSKGKWVSSFFKTMPSEIGFPMTLTSGAFVNKKGNKQTSHELQNNLDRSCISFCTSSRKGSLKHHKMTQNSVSFSYQ